MLIYKKFLKPSRKPHPLEKYERNLNILNMRLNGYGYTEIGKVFKIDKTRVKSLCFRYEKNRHYNHDFKRLCKKYRKFIKENFLIPNW